MKIALWVAGVGALIFTASNLVAIWTDGNVSTTVAVLGISASMVCFAISFVIIAFNLANNKSKG